jgi:hypothetical protein
MTYQEVHERVSNINNTLIKKGYSFDDIVKFWEEVFQEVKAKGQLKLKI